MDEYELPESIVALRKQSTLPMPPTVGMEIEDIALSDHLRVVRVVLHKEGIMVVCEALKVPAAVLKDRVSALTENGCRKQP
ncbi:MAG: hypothetical protein H7X91_09980 [Burkholderiales bacterium]|nr:hypothetical protein [Burkholderiales bacterium]